MSPDPSGEQPGPGRYGYRAMGQAYQGALEAVFAIVLATGAGYWVDSAFGSSPWCLLVGATIGFAAFVVRLYRLGTSLDPTSAVDPASAALESPEDAIQPEEPCERAAWHPGRTDRGAGSGGGQENGER
jgi:hypothetical protein